MSLITPTDLENVRELIATALAERVSQVDTESERQLLTAMADNVKGWTHTTRLRDFLAAIEADHTALPDLAAVAAGSPR